ncbi:sulfotransferase family 1, cytosolic sulfotransferase 5 isoform X1 [Pimephales promelas]|uniref:sulfotransferase family 1, cytosolic sulfotransferase 5 isoform X1 n=2 Tax=Pimephales promelas TaxID=90988 RepID=UPI001955F444|nr:sulfotransferase family 1, cytosolic sulfotransferase 5 isoform X1 [Pimephales promelas]
MKKEKKTFPFLFGMPDFKLMDMGNAHVLLFIINSTDLIKGNMDGTTRDAISQVQGIPFPERVVKHWARVEHFQASKEDLLIATYPKAGTTWTQEVVDAILNEGNMEKCRRAPTQVRMPFLEMTTSDGLYAGITKLEVMDPPRVIKTHLPIQLVPCSFWEAGCKVIYMARNPKDTVVSYYHFDRMNLTQPEPGTWQQYLEKFMTGQLGWGSWYDHVKGYWRERQNKKILYTFFEDMKEDPVREVTHIAQFLGKQLSKSVIDHIVQMTAFSAMRENPMANYSTIPDTIFDRTASEFMRKGEVGDWKNHFNAEEDAAFEEHYCKLMADCPIPIRFTI